MSPCEFGYVLYEILLVIVNMFMYFCIQVVDEFNLSWKKNCLFFKSLKYDSSELFDP